MLNKLRLKNVALVTEAEIVFSGGFNVLSGETGAGKSVILDALNFVLGAKADKTLIRHGEEFCMVEAIFSSLPNSIIEVLAEYDVEVEDEVIVKRKFDTKGNGYIKVNGENFTSSMLKKITSLLVDVHGQSEHFVLLSRAKQLECIDNAAKTESLKLELKKLCEQVNAIDEKINNFGGNSIDRARKIDVLKFQIDEIKSAELNEDEEKRLLEQRVLLLNAEKIASALSLALEVISGENGSIDSIITAEQALRNISSLDHRYEDIYGRIANLREDISDIAETVHDYSDKLSFEEINVEQVEARLEIYRNLKRKYGGSIDAVNVFLAESEKEYNELLCCDELLESLSCERKKIVETYYYTCLKLSEVRKSYADDFASRVKEKLKGLGMPSAEFYVDFAPIPDINELESFSQLGLDRIEFMFSANAGEPAKSLSKIISGGEMSRFMLALKTQAVSPCLTYIFDEIDAGISGITANVVAQNFAKLSIDKQVIAISHLPQIAAMSDNSILIAKNESDGKTFTTVTSLDENNKLKEIIRLIGGSDNDEIAVSHARNLITNAISYKKSLQNT